MRILTTLFITCILISCKNNTDSTENEPQSKPQIDELYALMQGSFNSEKQSITDTTYFNISLHMYPIWEDKGKYLYVEQALNSTQDRPYRQRVYHLTSVNDSVFSSAVYEIPNDSLWIGKWKDPSAFDQLQPSDLIQREGCAVYLQRLGENHYKGSTRADECKSTLRGASYATSTVEITSSEIASWDQGFNADGEQVWGATEGGYVFDKLN